MDENDEDGTPLIRTKKENGLCRHKKRKKYFGVKRDSVVASKKEVLEEYFRIRMELSNTRQNH